MTIKTLCTTALIAAVGVTLAGGVTANAAPTELDSTGSVIVTEGTGGGKDQGTVDPENPDKFLPTPDPESPNENKNPDEGPLALETTTNLDFGSIKTAANDVTAFAKPMAFTIDGTKTTRGAYVQWVDVRQGGTAGYTVTAKMTQQFTMGAGADAKSLTGSTIDFANGEMVAQGGNTNTQPSTVVPAFNLASGDDAKTVVTADKVKQEGKGRYIMEFGKSSATEGTPGTDANSVKLTVPSATASNMALGDYTAKVTWSLVAAE